MNIYPIYYRNSPVLIFAHTPQDAKVPYQRILGRTILDVEFAKELAKGEDIAPKEAKHALAGPGVSWTQIQEYLGESGMVQVTDKKKGFKPAPKAPARTPPKAPAPISSTSSTSIDSMFD